MSSKGGDGDTTQKTEPWEGLAPYLTDAYAQAQKLYQSGGPDFFSHGTYVPFSEQSNLGVDLLTNRALLGSQWDRPAGDLASNLMNQAHPYGLVAGQTMVPTARGDYLNANPYLDQMYNQAAKQVGQNWQETVMPGINATFASGGRTGSGTHALTLGRSTGELSDSLASMAANVYGNNYQSERDRQMAAASALTTMGESDVKQRLLGANLGLAMGQNEYADIGKLFGAGQMLEGKAGEIQKDLQNRWDFYQNRPEMQLNNYVSWLNNSPAVGSSSRTSTSSASNPLGSAIGGALTGAALTPLANAGLSSALTSMGVGGVMGTTAALAPWFLPAALGLGGLLS